MFCCCTGRYRRWFTVDIFKKKRKESQRARVKDMEKNGSQTVDQIDGNLEPPDYIRECMIDKDMEENVLETDLIMEFLINCPKADVESAENKKNVLETDLVVESPVEGPKAAVESAENEKNVLETDLIVEEASEVNIDTESEKVLSEIGMKTTLQDEIQNGSQTKMETGSTENLAEKNVSGKRKRRRKKKKAKKKVDTQNTHQVDGMLELRLSDVNKAECIKRKLIVLDVNGLLANIIMPAPKDYKEDVRLLGRAIFKRPFCDDFLKFCFQNFDVGVWSSRSKKVVDRVVEYLLGDLNAKLLFCWDLSHATETRFRTVENIHKPLVFKELRKIWENDDPNLPWKKGDYNESNTLLLDDSPYKALLNPLHTAIFPNSYDFKDENDNSLGPGGDLRVYLEGLLTCENFQSYVEQHPFGQSAINETNLSWDFYSGVLQNMSNNTSSPSCLPNLVV